MLGLSCRSARELLAHLRHSGDVVDGAATISNITSPQAEKGALNGLTSLFKMLWSWAFYPQFVGRTRHIWPYSTTEGSRNTRRHVPRRKENWTHLVKLHSWRPTRSTPVFFPAPQILKSQICCFSASLSTRRVRVDLVLVFKTYMKICCGDLWQAFVFLIKGIKHSYGVLHYAYPFFLSGRWRQCQDIWQLPWHEPLQERCQDRTERWEEFDLWMPWMN